MNEEHTARVNSPTEQRNPRTRDIDLLSTLDVLRLLNAEDREIPAAVEGALPELARAVDLGTAALRAGGRVHYVGAGTSGRLAVLDAAELVPTFNVPADWFVAHQAGGTAALRTPVENAEDDEAAAEREMRAEISEDDFVLGLAASGRTPYVLSALRTARQLGAGTALVTSNPGVSSNTGVAADVVIAVDTGPEPITGSTRMKAGTAQKLVLTSLSTTIMVRLGRTYSNLMVSMLATNAKLRGRTLALLREATGEPEDACAAALRATDGDLKTALLHLLSGADTARSAAALTSTGGQVRAALAELSDPA